jgi:hypothetical protein
LSSELAVFYIPHKMLRPHPQTRGGNGLPGNTVYMVGTHLK